MTTYQILALVVVALVAGALLMRWAARSPVPKIEQNAFEASIRILTEAADTSGEDKDIAAALARKAQKAAFLQHASTVVAQAAQKAAGGMSVQ